MRAALALVLACGGVAQASVVRRLPREALDARADLIVEGRVLSVRSSPTPGGLETEIRVAVTRRFKGAASPIVRILQPGGALGEARHVVVGMPTFVAGERVRLHLVARAGGGFRVYGWEQGVERLGPRAGDPEFTTNGMVWPADKIPVPYLIGAAGSDDVPEADVHAAIHAAFATWQAVPCATIEYAYAGTSDLTAAIDGQQVIYWVESDWGFGEEAAAATSLWIPFPEERTADVAMNGVDFHWAVGPAPELAPATLDIQSVLTHELGHFSGLGHTNSARDTMFVAWNPWQTQRTLSEDDQRGLCSLYPMEAYPCSEDRPCPTGEACRVYEHGTLCTRPADPIGAPCNREGVECDAFCLYGAEDLSVGICSRFCEADPDCPAGFGCREASAGSQIVRVCAVSSTPPDAGPPDAPGPCAVDDQCPAGQHCAAGACTYECREAIDCASGLTCDPTHGRCLPATGDGGGCGCHVSRRPRSAATALLLLALVLGLCRTGRPRFARRAPRHRLRRMNG